MTKNIHTQRLLILDFGSQYAQLIARRVRDAGVYCELLPCDVDAKDIEQFAPDGIIVSGGPETVTDMSTHRVPTIVFELGCPVLGICYGMQAMAQQLGGVVASSAHREFGYAQLEIYGHSKLLNDIEDNLNDKGQALLDVWMSHGDRVVSLPEGFKVTATTVNAPIAAMADNSRHFYGLQFHPEVTHTKQGKRIIERFVHDICGCESLWNPSNIIDDSLARIKKTVGQDKVILGLSGGVDSSVVAALLHKAIGDQLTCVFVDTGLLRLNEAEQVMKTFTKHMGVQVVAINAEERFLQALVGVSCPEDKRKVIGNLFVKIFEEQAKLNNDAKWLAQGTIYPDVIESAGVSGKSHVIKSHHNVGGLPDDMNMELVEPIRELFKDEVRKVGLELGLPYEMLYRHPFPGPGLGVRILGEVKKEFADLLRKADNIFIEELYDADLYHKISQAFVVFIPVKSVGVMGDARKYDYVVSLRAVETVDFMTAHWAHLPYEFLGKVSNRIINEVAGISRVTYDISGKPPATIEWE